MRKRRTRRSDPYRRVRKPVPPPERVEPDRRRQIEEQEARRELERAGRRVSAGEPPRDARPPDRSSRPIGFVDRLDAGRRLADALAHLPQEGVVVLGIPRGGVEVAAEVARVRGWPLDVVIPRKIRAPGNPELGLGAVAPGVRVLDERLVRTLGVSEEYLDREIAEEEAEIRRRAEAYREGRPAASLTGSIAVIVDDGIATGGTATAAVRWARSEGAERVILAVPVAPREAASLLAREADEVVCVETPEPFFAVGQWYRDFPQLQDGEVVSLLRAAR